MWKYIKLQKCMQISVNQCVQCCFFKVKFQPQTCLGPNWKFLFVFPSDPDPCAVFQYEPTFNETVCLGLFQTVRAELIILGQNNKKQYIFIKLWNY